MADHKDREPILFSQSQANASAQVDLFDQALAEILGSKSERQEHHDDSLRVRIFNTAIDSDGRRVSAR